MWVGAERGGWGLMICIQREDLASREGIISRSRQRQTLTEETEFAGDKHVGKQIRQAIEKQDGPRESSSLTASSGDCGIHLIADRA